MRSQRGYSLIEMMLVVGIVGVVAGMVLPITGASLNGSRLRGDATIIRNLVGVAKMRASAQFTRARLRANLGSPAANPPVQGTYVLQVWDKTANAWVNDGDVRPLSTGVRFGFAGLPSPPSNTQAAIGQSPLCTNTLRVLDGTIANTACVAFNSRGLPVDGDGNLFGGHAVYVTGNDAVYATTVTMTPLVRFWSSPRVTSGNYWVSK